MLLTADWRFYFGWAGFSLSKRRMLLLLLGFKFILGLWVSDLAVIVVALFMLLFSSISSFIMHLEISSLSFYLRLSLSVEGR